MATPEEDFLAGLRSLIEQAEALVAKHGGTVFHNEGCNCNICRERLYQAQKEAAAKTVKERAGEDKLFAIYLAGWLQGGICSSNDEYGPAEIADWADYIHFGYEKAREEATGVSPQDKGNSPLETKTISLCAAGSPWGTFCTKAVNHGMAGDDMHRDSMDRTY